MHFMSTRPLEHSELSGIDQRRDVEIDRDLVIGVRRAHVGELQARQLDLVSGGVQLVRPPKATPMRVLVPG